MFFRLSDVTGKALASASVGMAGSSTMLDGGTVMVFFRLAEVTGQVRNQVSTVGMSGVGTLNVALPSVTFRLAAVSGKTLGQTAALTMAGTGTLLVAQPAAAFFRFAAAAGFAPAKALVWDGSEWVPDIQSSTLTFTGTSTLSISGSVGPLFVMAGRGQMFINAPIVATPTTLLMAGTSVLLVSDQPPAHPAAVGMDGTSNFTVSGLSSFNLLFTPPMRRQVVVMEGSLRYSFLVSSTVWKDLDGTWHAQEVPYDGNLVNAFALTGSGPVVVDEATAAELITAGIGTITEE